MLVSPAARSVSRGRQKRFEGLVPQVVDRRKSSADGRFEGFFRVSIFTSGRVLCAPGRECPPVPSKSRERGSPRSSKISARRTRANIVLNDFSSRFCTSVRTRGKPPRNPESISSFSRLAHPISTRSSRTYVTGIMRILPSEPVTISDSV